MIARLVACVGVWLVSSGALCVAGELRDSSWESRSAAQRQFQQELCNLLSSRWPGLERLFQVSRDLQMAYIDLQTARFYSLLEHEPGRIVRGRGGSALANFAWAPEDDAALRAANAAYAELDRRVQELRRANDDNPGWPEARDRLRTIAQDSEYLEIVRRFREATKEIEGGEARSERRQ